MMASTQANTTDQHYEITYWRAGCAERCKSGSEGGGWKPAPRSIVPVARRHDDRQGAGRLPYSVSLANVGWPLQIFRERLSRSRVRPERGPRRAPRPRVLGE